MKQTVSVSFTHSINVELHSNFIKTIVDLRLVNENLNSPFLATTVYIIWNTL